MVAAASEPVCHIQVSFQCDPQQCDALVATAIAAFKRFVKEGPTVEELELQRRAASVEVEDRLRGMDMPFMQ